MYDCMLYNAGGIITIFTGDFPLFTDSRLSISGQFQLLGLCLFQVLFSKKN